MILTDAGPLVSLLNEKDPSHARCVSGLESLSRPMVTTWPSFTEAMYLLGAGAGWRGQELLWRLVRRGDLELVDITPLKDLICDLMERYKDLPMDLADASLVALAENRRLRRVFTLDRDFYVYRLPGGGSFEVVPRS